MTTETKQILINRGKSFAWRLGSFILVSAVAFLADNAGLFASDPKIIAIIALIAGEITKALNNTK